MIRWPHVAGVALGLVMAAAAMTFLPRNDGSRLSSGPVLSEIDGRLGEIVIHYDRSARDISLPVYRDLLRWLDGGVIVHVVTPSQEAYDELAAGVGPVKCRLRAIVVHHPMTTWSRDRWLALSPKGNAGSDPTTIWMPRGEALAAEWPERAGDEQTGFDVAKALAPAARARRSALYFDGGDFLADDETVFAAPRMLARNIQVTTQDRAELLRSLSADLQRPVILLNEAPDHHAAMFMASIGNKTVMVGDPSLGRSYLSAASVDALLPGGADFTPETQHLFDAVAEQAAAAGYKVVRAPVLPGADGRTFLTYVNSIIERFDGRQIVYLPFYRGADALNEAARKIWEDRGYEVRPVDCTSAYRQFGALHCLVNVLRRERRA